jgi:hypothetical protein
LGRLTRETESLRARLAKYEAAAAVVMEAAEASGVDLKRVSREAAYKAEASGSKASSSSARPALRR